MMSWYTPNPKVLSLTYNRTILNPSLNYGNNRLWALAGGKIALSNYLTSRNATEFYLLPQKDVQQLLVMVS